MSLVGYKVLVIFISQSVTDSSRHTCLNESRQQHRPNLISSEITLLISTGQRLEFISKRQM